MEGYSDVDPWSWTVQQSENLPQNYVPMFDPPMYSSGPSPINSNESMQSRHQSIASPHPVNPAPIALLQKGTPPPRQQQHQVSAGPAVKAQPAFKPTWHGVLETTKDAMTIVEAALQGRLSHISRRPHDKERAEMLTSGTVLVYEENASGIKRWTDAVHWSPSRVMNNCLIYRQLVRALRPEEKKASLNSSCGNKRKRKESASPAVTNSGDIVNVADDEYEHSALETQPEDASPTEPFEKVYENFAQKLTLEQQRRYCGSLIDSYEFKEGGLMKKTISVKYQGTHHHIISYYTLEDVVSGKLKRPFQDPKLADIVPRPELLTGWKVSLDDEESKDSPQFGSYPPPIQPSSRPGDGTSSAQTQNQRQAPSLQVATDFWSGAQMTQYSPAHHPPSFVPQSAITSPYAPQVSQEYPGQTTPIQQYHAQEPHAPQFQQPTPPNYPPTATHTQQYPAHPTPGPGPSPQYHSAAQAAQQYSIIPTAQYGDQTTALHYREAEPAQQTQFAVPQSQNFDISVPVTQLHTPSPHSTQSPTHPQGPHRRASSTLLAQQYGQVQQTRYQPDMQPQSYFMQDQKARPGGYGY